MKKIVIKLVWHFEGFQKLKNSLFLMYLQSIHSTTEAHISSIRRLILSFNFINSLKELPAACHKLSLSYLKKIKGSEHFSKKIVNNLLFPYAQFHMENLGLDYFSIQIKWALSYSENFNEIFFERTSISDRSVDFIFPNYSNNLLTTLSAKALYYP